MPTFREITIGLRSLGIPPGSPVIAHASLSAFGDVLGGAETVVGALLSLDSPLIMPTFTYKTMVTPEIGPHQNALSYGSGKDANRMAEFYRPDMPADRLMGRIPETLRQLPQAQRSLHPILSFSGVDAEQALQAQTIEEPLAPIRMIAGEQGWVLLLGVDHTVDTSIHYAERLAGRRQFLRWALTPQGVVTCPGFPGCSNGFEELAAELEGVTRQARIGRAKIRALPLQPLIELVCQKVEKEPLALLCSRVDCERCSAVRSEIARELGFTG